jgi:twitching motility protein PilT
VISAIHTPDAVSTIQRYVGLFEPDAQDVIRERLGDCLQAVVSLRLLVAQGGPQAPARGRDPARDPDDPRVHPQLGVAWPTCPS